MAILCCYFILIVVLLLINFTCQNKPNVLFLIVDDLRPNLGAYNYKNAHTPNIDKLAEKSFIFTNAFAQQALCAPSRNSFLTSRRPDSLHLYDFYSYWRNSVGNFTTLPQHFKENGYFTHSIGKVFHPGISSNFTDDAKYSWSDIPYHPSTEKYKEAKVCLTKNGTKARNLICPVIVDEQPEETLPDIQSVNAAIDFLKRRENLVKSEPYFLAVGLHKPHIPFKYPQHYLKYHPLEEVDLPVYRYKPPNVPNVAWNPWTDVRHRDDITLLNISFPFGHMPDSTTKKIIQSYNAATTYIDALLGTLFKKINENTLIVLIGDHGWSMGEHGEFSKFSNYDVATKVPLIIHVPKLIKKNVVIKNLVELVDLFPTLVDLTNISPSIPVCKRKTDLCTEGKSLVPLMISKLKNQEYKYKNIVFTQYPRPGNFPTLNPNSDKPKLKDIKIMGYSIRTERYRYTEWIGFDNKNFKKNWTDVYGKEMYDHLIDPNENLNLADRKELSEIIQWLRKKLILGWRFA